MLQFLVLGLACIPPVLAAPTGFSSFAPRIDSIATTAVSAWQVDTKSFGYFPSCKFEVPKMYYLCYCGNKGNQVVKWITEQVDE
jgi:hypothetical protein